MRLTVWHVLDLLSKLELSDPVRLEIVDSALVAEPLDLDLVAEPLELDLFDAESRWDIILAESSMSSSICAEHNLGLQCPHRCCSALPCLSRLTGHQGLCSGSPMVVQEWCSFPFHLKGNRQSSGLLVPLLSCV